MLQRYITGCCVLSCSCFRLVLLAVQSRQTLWEHHPGRWGNESAGRQGRRLGMRSGRGFDVDARRGQVCEVFGREVKRCRHLRDDHAGSCHIVTIFHNGKRSIARTRCQRIGGRPSAVAGWRRRAACLIRRSWNCSVHTCSASVMMLHCERAM